MDIAFIDGENTKGRIKDVFIKHKRPIPDWSTYDFEGLFDEAFKLYIVTDRRFFRALPKRHDDIPQESEALLIAYRNLGGHLNRQGFTVMKAGTLRADYRNDGDAKPRYREKGVDVSLAVSMVSLACDRQLEKAYLVASDSDYQPAVAEVRRRGKKVIYVGFEVNPNLGLIAKTDDRIIIPDLMYYGLKVSLPRTLLGKFLENVCYKHLR
ncbi:MAG: NYN domain-containing protein [Candidatus Pacebacteria bacterium]|nr:NYN domain-containing protein [Candidatus Paceibacterota bacterium]